MLTDESSERSKNQHGQCSCENNKYLLIITLILFLALEDKDTIIIKWYRNNAYYHCYEGRVKLPCHNIHCMPITKYAVL